MAQPPTRMASNSVSERGFIVAPPLVPITAGPKWDNMSRLLAKQLVRFRIAKWPLAVPLQAEDPPKRSESLICPIGRPLDSESFQEVYSRIGAKINRLICTCSYSWTPNRRPFALRLFDLSRSERITRTGA